MRWTHVFIPAKVRAEIKRVLNRWPKICPQVRAWAEQRDRGEIVQVHFEGHQRLRELPDASVSDVPKSFEAHTRYPVYDRTLFCLSGAKVRGQDGVILLPDGSASHQTAWSRAQILGSDGYRLPASCEGVKKSGNWFSLILYWGTGYYHWFNDVLSLLYENLEIIPEDTRFLVPAGMAEVHWRSLELLGVPRDRCVVFDGKEIWELEKLWYQPPAVHPDDQTPMALQWIGSQIKDRIGLGGEGMKSRRIYVSRQEAHKRGIVNEPEVISVLRRHGFEVFLGEARSFDDQVRAFAAAECVVAPHGAGLTNLIFAEPGTRVLELFASNRMARRCYWALSTELDLRYHCLIGSEGEVRDGEPDIHISSLALENSLKHLLG